MYDIHCHILPGIDDGSGSLNDSIEMAKLASESGTEGIVATPHCNIPRMYENFYNNDFSERINTLNAALMEQNIPVTVYPGQEVYAYGEVIPLMKSGKIIGLNKSRYVLTEFDFGAAENDVYPFVYKLLNEGYVPVVAHPERCDYTRNNPDVIVNLKKMGALIQLNAESIIGRIGFYPKTVSRFVLENGFADFVASDAHSQYSRTPDLSEAHEFVCRFCSYDYADQIFSVNPFNAINNLEIR
ncbi:MAG: hypothetical protein IKJ69_01105 [Clostridia bacterium]|nr:hypothetical protein [Clostridia bacterium]